MAEFWSVMDFNPMNNINPTQSLGYKKLDPGLDPLYPNSHKKNFQLIRLRNGRVIALTDTFPVGTGDETGDETRWLDQ